MENVTVQANLLKSLTELQSALRGFEAELTNVARGAEIILEALQQGRKILTCGNGGSAADALHLAEELVGKFCKTRRSLPAVSLAADPTLLTCIANDFGFDRVFSRQVEGLGNAGDVLVVFSTSGNSANIRLALEAARACGVKSIAILGKDGGKAKGLANCEIIVKSNTTARIQEIHTLVLHMWLETLEEHFT
jgi:D-sedoheptulose 7-phosphate isomerase